MGEIWAKMKRKYRYKGRRITVWWDGGKCDHNGNCLRTLPTVFNVKRPRWIAPDNASPEKVKEVCGECPTGALSYELQQRKEEALG